MKIINKISFKVFILLFLFIFAYWVPLKTMVFIWWTNDDYSYGFLVPLISIYLFYERRKILINIFIINYWKILPFLIFFIIISLYGILGSSGNVSMPSVPILIILFTLFCFGKDTLKKLFLPIAFLIFMTPVPDVIERTIGIVLKSISTNLGGWIIRTVGISIHISGNIIDLGTTQLQVVDACSGMRYLFALLALGVLYAYFFEHLLWKRVVSVIITIPISILTNAIRVGITGVLASKYGNKVAEDFFHGFSGWAIFMIAFGFLFVFGKILKLLTPKIVVSIKDEKEFLNYTNQTKKNINPAFFTSVILLAIVAIFTWGTKALPPFKLNGGIANFPLDFKEWQGRSEYVDPDIIIRSGAEESFSGVYRNNDNDEVLLYIGYRSTAFLANENFFHSPTVCLPAAGWKIKTKDIHIINNVQPFGKLEVAKLVMEYMGNEQLVYYWFQTKSKISHDKNINRFHLALHAIMRDNTYDLFIRPVMSIRKDQGIKKTEEKMDQFVRDMMEVLIKFIKDRQMIN